MDIGIWNFHCFAVVKREKYIDVDFSLHQLISEKIGYNISKLAIILDGKPYSMQDRTASA